MAQEESIIQSFSGGELSPDMEGRIDLPVYRTGAKNAQNFIIATQGGARYRPGFQVMNHTKGNQVARVITFQFNDEQTYHLEFTDRKMRVFKDTGVVLESVVGNISQINIPSFPFTIEFDASPAHQFTTADEVFLTGVPGGAEVSELFYSVTGFSATTVELGTLGSGAKDVSVANGYTAGNIAAGTSQLFRIYEIDTPYEVENDFWKLKFTQSADVMYIVHPDYEPRKLTRLADNDWTLSRFTRTADFIPRETITGFVAGDPGAFTAVAHGLEEDDKIYMEDLGGTFGLLTSIALLAGKITDDTFHLKDAVTGLDIDLTGHTWGSTGYVAKRNDLPAAVAFHESRLWYGGAVLRPDQFQYSRSPEGPSDPTPGATRYDDFTLGVDADHAGIFSIADDEINKILWFKGTERILLAGTFGSLMRIAGETTEAAITPTSINVRSIDNVGVEPASPLNTRNLVVYAERGGVTVASLEFDALTDGFAPSDRNIVSSTITQSGLKELAWQTGRPDIAWCVRNDGLLIGMTAQSKENIFAWHRHPLGFEPIGTIPATERISSILGVTTSGRPAGTDRVVITTERKLSEFHGTCRRVEFLADDPVIPRREDFFTSVHNEVEDTARYVSALSRAQQEYVNLDGAIVFAGTTTPVSDNIVQYAALTGDDVTFTFSGNIGDFVLRDIHIGRQIWKKPVNGVGTGRAVITSILTDFTCKCRIIEDFDGFSAMQPGDWAMTRQKFFGFEDYIGLTVAVVADGQRHPDVIPNSEGVITLERHAAHAVFGFPYSGFVRTMPVEIGGETGPGQTKIKHINRTGIRFQNVLGAEVGTNLYRPEQVIVSEMPFTSGRPTPLFTGVKQLPISDDWSIDKTVYIRQLTPFPCDVLQLVLYGETDND